MFKELLTKTNIANVVSAIVCIGATGLAIYSQNWEMLKWIGAFALGYLFGASE